MVRRSSWQHEPRKKTRKQPRNQRTCNQSPGGRRHLMRRGYSSRANFFSSPAEKTKMGSEQLSSGLPLAGEILHMCAWSEIPCRTLGRGVDDAHSGLMQVSRAGRISINCACAWKHDDYCTVPDEDFWPRTGSATLRARLGGCILEGG